MTEKRFELNNIVKKGTVSFWDNKKQKILNASHILDELNNLNDENEQLRKENQKLESLWEDKCIREYTKIVGEYALEEMHKEKYGDKE